MSTVIIEDDRVDELEIGELYDVLVVDKKNYAVITIGQVKVQHIRTGESALLQSNDHESDSSGPEGS